MTLNEFNEYLCNFDAIMVFTSYLYRINDATFNVNREMIKDFIFMYGKTKPCIPGKNIYNYNGKKDIIGIASISTKVRKFNLREYKDFIIENNEYILSPSSYYKLIFSSDDDELIDQFNKIFTYSHMYNIYLKIMNQ